MLRFTQMKQALALIIILMAGLSLLSAEQIYNFQVNSIDGVPVKLEQYKGKVLLIVNTASKCGFTGQYEDLQQLYELYQQDGLVVLGFPANNFLHQEPGDNSSIQQFCQQNYGVSFPMFEKISVKGKNIHPLYKYLTAKKSNPNFSGKISWNFSKFLISRDGKIIGRFAPATNPMDSKVLTAVAKALQ